MYFQILFLIALLSVMRIAYQIILDRRCIDERTFENFRHGKLKDRDEESYRRVVRHLGTCEKCAKKLEYLNFGKPVEDHLIDET
jgi:hypothetical protein